MQSYFYKIYGLTIKSSIELTELESISEHDAGNNIDVIIKYEKVEEWIHEKIKNNIFEEYTMDNSWMYIDDIAIYEMIKGREIIVESLGGILHDIKSFLLGSALGCILIQRNIMAVHGSTVMLNNKTVILTGESGAGKSTLSSAFRMRGCKFLSDDISAIDINNNKEIIVNPAYPQQKLCRDAAIKLGLNIDNLQWIDEERDKFAIPSYEQFEKQSKKLDCIFQLEICNDDKFKGIETKEICGADKIELILNNIYRIEYVYMMGRQQEYLKKAIKTASKVKCFKIIRSNNTFTLEEEINQILQKVQGLQCEAN